MTMYKMTERQKDIAWLAATLLLILFVAGWIYGRIQLSGWMPLPFSLMMFIAATYQLYGLVGRLLKPASKFATKLLIVVVLLLVVVSISMVLIFSLSRGPESDQQTTPGISVPAQESRSAEADSTSARVIIDVRHSDYGFRADGGAVTDLESLIARCQELVSSDPELQVVVSAKSDVSHTRVVEVLNALTAAGVSNISIATATD